MARQVFFEEGEGGFFRRQGAAFDPASGLVSGPAWRRGGFS